MVVSLGIHAVLIVVAISFVAVRVVQKADKQFEAPKVNRPRLPPKKLQVPVKMKKKRPKPKLRKQITVKTRMDQRMPDIKMPEITGIKGGLGSAAAGNIGSVAGVGFSMPEIEVFGVKSRGEKVFLVLDSRNYIMYDEVGGLLDIPSSRTSWFGSSTAFPPPRFSISPCLIQATALFCFPAWFRPTRSMWTRSLSGLNR